MKHFIEQLATQCDVAAGGVDVEEGVADVDILVVAEFEDVGVDALRLGDLAGVGEGLEEGREGEVVGEDGVEAHAGVDEERVVWSLVLGMGEGSDEGVEGVNVGVVKRTRAVLRRPCDWHAPMKCSAILVFG